MGTPTSGRRRGRPPYPLLTPAEERVLGHVRQGLTNAEIATRLGVTLDAVKYHVSNMLGKLELENREQLAAWREPAGLRRAWAGVAGVSWKILVPAGVGAAGLVAAALFAVLPIEFTTESDDIRTPFDPNDLFIGTVSTGLNGEPADGPSSNPSISGDGRLVAFESTATNLVPGDTNGVSDIFVFDRLTEETRRVSLAPGGKQANGGSFRPSISEDGKWVAFDSQASNLVPDDVNGELDRALQALPEERRKELESPPDGSGAKNFADAVGHWGGSDVFVVELDEGDIELVSVTDDEERGNLGSFSPSISGDGALIAFESTAPNLAGIPFAVGGPPGGANFGIASADWVFVRDRDDETTTLVSKDRDGNAPNFGSGRPEVSEDGRVVAFVSRQVDLTGSSSLIGGSFAFYVWERSSGQLTRADVPLPQGASQAGRFRAFEASSPALSQDGSSVAFYSQLHLFGGSSPPATEGAIYLLRDGAVRQIDVQGGEPVTNQSYAGLAFVSESQLVIQVSQAAAPGSTFIETRLVLCDIENGTCAPIAHPEAANLYVPAASNDGTAITGIRFGRSPRDEHRIIVFQR